MKHNKTLKALGFLAIILLSANVFAQDSFTVGKMKYTITDAVNKIVEAEPTSTSVSGKVVVPASVTNGSTTYKVTLKVNCFEGCSQITDLKLCDGLKIDTTLWKNSAPTGLESIELPKMGEPWDIPKGFLVAKHGLINLKIIYLPLFDITKYTAKNFREHLSLSGYDLSSLKAVVFKESFAEHGIKFPGAEQKWFADWLRRRNVFFFANYCNIGEWYSVAIDKNSYYGQMEYEHLPMGMYIDTIKSNFIEGMSDAISNNWGGIQPGDFTCADTVVIENGASFYFTNGSKLCLDPSGFDGFNGLLRKPSVIVQESKIPVDKWSLINSTANNRIYEFLDDNFGDKNTDKQHAFAVNDWDYSKNDWGEDFMKYNDACPDHNGSFFAWPFNEELNLNAASPTVLDDDYVTIRQTMDCEDMNFGTVHFTAKNTGAQYSDARFFALGNPYYVTINLVSFAYKNRLNIQGNLVYLWDNTLETPDWKAVNVSYGVKRLEPATGFMVASAGSAETLNVDFNAYFIVDEFACAEYKALKDNVITFSAVANGVEKQMWGRLSEGAKDGFDREDGYFMASANENAVTPYFVIDNRNIVDNYFSTLPYTFNVNFASAKNNDVELRLQEVPQNIEVTVIDVLNGNEETTLSKDEPFIFNVNAGENSGKYKIRFAKKDDVSINDVTNSDDNISISAYNNAVYISANNLTDVQIINTLGQIVYSARLSGNEAKINADLNTGAYLVKVNTANGSKTEKVIIK